MTCNTTITDDSLNIGEFGQTLRFNVGEDISGATVSLVFYPPNQPEITKTSLDGVVIATADVIIDGYLRYLANEYVTYVIEDGLLSISGTWRVRLIVETTSPDTLRKSEFATIKVTL